jgi:hypothetical protein
MALSNNDLVELAELCNDLADGVLSEAQGRRLSQWLDQSEDARQFYARFVALSASLREYAAESQTCPAPAESGETRPKPSRAFWKRWLPLKWAWGLGVAVAVVVLGFWLWGGLKRDSSNTPEQAAFPSATAGSSLAVLGQCAEAQWRTPATFPQPGQELSSGWLHLSGGAAQLEFFSGARVIVEGPAEFELVSAMQVRVRQGKVHVMAPPSARGFSVLGPGMEIVDLGTEFGLSVPADQPPEVHVFRGKVVVSQEGNTPALEVSEGRALRLAGTRAEDIPLRSSAFLTELGLAGRASSLAHDRMTAWQRAGQDLSRDSATLVHYTFDGQANWGRSLKNQSAFGKPGTDGNIVGGRWAQGRWPGKGALEFRGQSDRVLLAPSILRSNVTFMTWVRVDALTQPNSALVVSEGPVRWQLLIPAQSRSRRPASVPPMGLFRWELRNNGITSFNVVRSQEGRKVQWDIAPTPPVLTSEWLGQWVQLAVTYDTSRGEVTHYFNGRIAARVTLRNLHPLSLDLLEVGNMGLGAQAVQQGLNYAFHGAMDELLILDRILSSDEILALHAVGQARLGNVALARSEPPRP